MPMSKAVKLARAVGTGGVLEDGEIQAAQVTGLATVASTNSYTDLINKPTIPSITGLASETYVDTQINNLIGGAPGTLDTLKEIADQLATDQSAVGALTAVVNSKASTESLAAVATSGSYTDLLDKPAIPSGNYEDLINKPVLAAVATSGSYADLSDAPTLATVATSGSYTDLVNKPTVISLKVTSIVYPGDDLAADIVGGQTITLTGTGFESTPVVYIGGVLAPSVTFVNSTELLVTTPARTAGTYDIYVVNPGGATAIMVFGISYSGTPAWTTPAGSLGTFSGTFSIQLQATGDAPVTYSLTDGSVLPSGVTLSSAGLLTGSGFSSDQTFNFSVTATDLQNQDTPRTFLVNILIGDPFFRNVIMLLQGDATNGGQNNTFLDSSTNNFTITRNGNTTQGSFSPYGPNWSNFFDGTGDYLSTTGSYSLSGNFTYESFIYFLGNNARPFGIGDTGTNQSTSLDVYVGTSGTVAIDGNRIFSSIALNINAWNHIALVRNSGTYTLYINGTSAGTSSFSGTLSGTTYIGAARYNGTIYAGEAAYYSSTRVVASAVYTANFTPSTTPLTAISGTSLLTCQSNRFIDNSTNNFAITVNGDVSVQRFSPFAPPAAYSAATLGGSGYFDQTDYLTPPSNSAFAFGTGDFTVEGWFYDSGSVFGTLLYQSGSANTSGSLWVGWYGSPNLYFRIDGLSNDITATVNCPRYQWFHFAATRQSGTVRVFVNGAQVLTGTRAQNITQQSPLIGYEPAGGSYNLGYTASYRVVKGTAVYTAAFTPPTAPVTAITNTSLLCNFTNAAIFDNAMMNDLETVGNAQISTSVVKYGTGSIFTAGGVDFLKSSPSVNHSFGAGNFTIELWYYPIASSGSFPRIFEITQNATGSFSTGSWLLMDRGLSAGYGFSAFNINSSGNLVFSSSQSVVNGAWVHLALVRNGTTITLYINGVADGSTTSSTSLNTGVSYVWVGGGSDANSTSNSYIDDFRITKGVARYTANFTPPTAAFLPQ
jgi:hypothetical protein